MVESERSFARALAARALLLDRGDVVCIKLAGDPDDAERLADAVEDALEAQYAAGLELFPFLAHPDAIGLAVITTPRGSNLLIEHVAEGESA